MRICLASWLLEVSQGESLTKVNANNRLLSYFHTIEKADQLPKYVITGRNKPAIVKRNYEIWKDIKGFPGYQISCFGRVRSGFKILRLKYKDYIQIGLYLNKKQIFKTVNLLVLIHFGPPKPGPYHECNHKDGDKYNNWWTNLEWVTHKENIQHAIKLGLRNNCCRGKHHLSKLTENEVNEIREKYSTGKFSQRKLGRIYKVAGGTIHYIVNNINWRNK